MNIICFDIESTINNKGQPFDLTNKIVSIAWTDGTQSQCVKADDYGRHFIQRAIDKADLLIGFNIKFDINWLRRFGISFDNKRVYDCQLAEYIIRRQRVKYPSLSTTLETYGLEGKLDIVKEDYWKKGIDTDQIPWDILSKYNIQDVEQTLKVYHEQQKITNPIQKRLIQLCCDDLIVLQEMEFNGIPCDLDQCHRESDKIKEEIGKITNELGSRYPQVPLNFNSTDHLSAFLYGGTVHEEGREIAGLIGEGFCVGFHVIS